MIDLLIRALLIGILSASMTSCAVYNKASNLTNKSEFTNKSITFKKLTNVMLGKTSVRPSLIKADRWEYIRGNLRIKLPAGWEFFRRTKNGSLADSSTNELSLKKYIGDSVLLASMECGLNGRDTLTDFVTRGALTAAIANSLSNGTKLEVEVDTSSERSFKWHEAYYNDGTRDIEGLATQYFAFYKRVFQYDKQFDVETSRTNGIDSFKSTLFDKHSNVSSISYGAVIEDSLLRCQYINYSEGLHSSVEAFNQLIATMEYVKSIEVNQNITATSI